MSFLPVAEQLEIIKRGIVDLIPEEDMYVKLERSCRQSVPLRVKLGCDPSRPDLHLGHSVVLRKLRQFQDLGHQAILVVGDFTGMIGDPSGRNKTRPSLTLEETRRNGESYFNQAARILDKTRTQIVYNSEWLGKMSFADVVRLASQYTVARMLERDDFDQRYRNREPISIHELLYPLAQAMDSVALQADVELGGTDQRFNLLVGRDIQKEYGQEQQVIITLPILEGTDGVQKMSKSLDNYVGLEDSPRDMFGRLMSIPDTLIYKYFELLTDVPLAEQKVIAGNLNDPTFNPSHAKRRLAREIITMYHGATDALKAEEEFDLVFKKKDVPDDIPVFTTQTGTWSLPKLLTETKLVESGNEARRQISQGAVSIGGTKITDEKYVIHLNGDIVIKVGKRKFLRVRKGS